MKKDFLPLQGTRVFSSNIIRTLALSVVALVASISSYAHRVETFIFGCVSPGQTLTVDAVIVAAPADTWYQWQYMDNTGVWKCFVNGTNTINGVSFTVSGATAQNVANDAPLLSISNANSLLENVVVRVLMRAAGDPCSGPAGTVYGGDDIAPDESKNLRLHVFGNASICPPNSYLCDGNMVFNADGYYGGFENKTYSTVTNTYTSTNFGAGIASSDLTFGGTPGHYQDINNPYSITPGFPKLAPHTGNFQLVVMGNNNSTDRAWYKSIAVASGNVYQFAVFAARLETAAPIITLKVDGTTIQTSDLSLQPIGAWTRIVGQFTATATGNVTISVGDSRAGGGNNFSLDDICFRQCLNCASLPLHNLTLMASLQSSTVGLRWTAENEMNTSTFVIERSTDNNSYVEVGAKPASGQTNTITEYKSTDDITALQQTASVVYYRLRAIDVDGRFTYSNVVTVRLNKKAGVQVWPSPFKSNINISYNAAVNTTVEVSVISSSGKIVKQANYNVSRGINQLSVSELSSLSPGVYFVRITDKNTEETFMQKMIK